MDQNADIFPAYRLVAQFADGQRLTFDGLTEQQAQNRMEAAQALHGDICWYDGVTDQHYENGHFYKITPPPPTINMIDLTDYHEKCPARQARRQRHPRRRKSRRAERPGVCAPSLRRAHDPRGPAAHD